MIKIFEYSNMKLKFYEYFHYPKSRAVKRKTEYVYMSVRKVKDIWTKYL